MKDIGRALVSPLWAVGRLMKPKTPKLPAPLPAVTRDPIRDRQALEDELRKRRGGAADIVTGYGGAEPAVETGKTVLGA